MQLMKLLVSISRARVVAVFAAGLVSGAANAYLLYLISHVLSSQVHTSMLRFVVTGSIALVGSVVSRLLLIRFTQDAVYQLREQLSSAVISAPLERLERLGVHRLLATLTQDVRSLSRAVAALPNVCVDVVTILGCLVFLATVSGPIFAVTVAGMALSTLVVQLLSRRVRRRYREAREDEDALLRSFQSALVGIKELKLHRGRRRDFMDRHLLEAADDLRDQNVEAGSRMSLAQTSGRAIQLCTMVFILFVLATALDVPRPVMISYVLVAMYLTRPMRSFWSRIPDLMQGDVALAKIRAMSLSMETAHNEQQLPYPDRPAATKARLELTNLNYTYPTEFVPASEQGPGMRPQGPPLDGPRSRRRGSGGPTDGPARRGPRPGLPGAGRSGFRLGPLDVVFEPGQISFVVGGNGSGKSTLAKLVTGLYMPQTGFVTLNGERIGRDNVEWFRQNCSAVFTDFHLFEDYLGFDRPGIDDEVRHYLRELQLAHKVTVQDGRLSTTALSQGQRKRLVLLTALLEDRPIYVFDEWAADQEPRFREVFYTEILPGLKQRGKTVIVITHDDRYFHCADQIVKLDFGHIEDTTPPAPIRAGDDRLVSAVSVNGNGGGSRRPAPSLCDHASATDRVEYRSWMSDNLRWDALELREGDIVISTPPGCGTTWTQRLVSLLVFDGPDLPGPLSRVSPWLDLTSRPLEVVVARLDAQEHRRFIKTHTPLDGLVLDDRVTYIGVGRDPRDAAVSMLHQAANMDLNRMRAMYEAVVPPNERIAPRHPDLDREPNPLEALREWMERPIMPTGDLVSLATILHHFGTVWHRRHLPNVAMFHYADLKADLVGELVRLGQALGFDLGRDRAAELAKHATLDAMRARASELTPGARQSVWRNKERFFRAGGGHQWREIFTEAEHRRYIHRAAELAPPDLLAWAHQGRRGHDPAS